MDRTLMSADLGAFASGMLDVIFAFSIVLERKGLMDRAEIVDTLRQVQAQTTRDGPAARSTVVDLMLQAFNIPVAGEQARARLTVIAGGSER